MNRQTSYRRMNRILAAGTLAGLVLATFLVLGLRDVSRVAASGAAPVVEPVSNTTSVDGTVTVRQEDLARLQAYTQQLESAVQTMSARESVYQTQLSQANQVIMQLQQQSNRPFNNGRLNFNQENERGDD